MSKVIIIGGGIIGVCSGIALLGEGHDVTLIDRGQPQAAASYGNCGLLAVGEVVPISKPGVLAKIPKWLADPEGPLFLRPSALASHMGWLLRFLAAGRRSRVEQIAQGMAPLLHQAEADYRDLLGRAGIASNLVASENIMAFNSRASYDNDRFSWDLRDRLGFKHEFLDRDALKQLEPNLSGPITCGVLLRGWLQFSDPGLVTQRLAAHFTALGGKCHTAEVAGLETKGGQATGVRLADGDHLAADILVLAAGAWSGRLARDLGLRAPVAALQGYHHQVPNPNVSVNRPVLYADGGFVLTPLETGLRIGGTIEVGGTDLKPNFARADVIARKAQQVLPGLDISGGRQWMGPRPFMPDTLPVLGRAPRHDNVVLAFGHGQVGMTLGATTGRIVADLVARRPDRISLAPYRPDRF